MKNLLIILAVAGAVVFAALCAACLKHVTHSAGPKGPDRKTIAERVQQYGDIARDRLAPHFKTAGVEYPPKRVTLVGLKDERVLQVYATDGGGAWRFVEAYPILGACGGPGPKLREGDYQVPEGIYPIDLLNPNSSYHLALRIGYPNYFDLQQAARESRTNLGGGIMIHGDIGSVGCLAMGEEASEDLFVLAADTGLPNLTVVLSPVDFRAGKGVASSAKLPAWTPTLYAQIKDRLAELPLVKKSRP